MVLSSPDGGAVVMLKDTKKEVWAKGVGGPVVWAFSAFGEVGNDLLWEEGEGKEGRGEEEVEGEEIDVDVCLVYKVVGGEEDGKERGEKDYWNESQGGGGHSLIDENVVYFNGEEGGYFAVPLERAVRVEGGEGKVVGEEEVIFFFLFSFFFSWLFLSSSKVSFLLPTAKPRTSPPYCRCPKFQRQWNVCQSPYLKNRHLEFIFFHVQQ